MTKEADEKFNQLLRLAQEDPNILGFFVGGSRGKGFGTKHSDYDPWMVVNDDKAQEYKGRYEHSFHPEIEMSVFSLTEFESYAEGEDESWDRYNFSHLHVEVDKLNGMIQELVNRKGSLALPQEERDTLINGALDAYINSVYRSIKNYRDNLKLGSHLDATESIPHLLTALSTANNKLRPYNKYLEWELDKLTTQELILPSQELKAMIKLILETGDIETQQIVLIRVEQFFRAKGYQDVFDGLEEKLPWMKN